MNRPIVAIVMAGGTGTRLYPASRSDRPKQFLSFGGDRSLLTRTVDRLGFADEIVVTTRPEFADRIGEHAPDAEVLVEPKGKDTGPALAYAAYWASRRFDNPILLNLPSDHHIEGDFERYALRATDVAARTDGLVAMGVEPGRPATGYGYIKPGEAHDGYFEIARFHEKPDAETAQRYLDCGQLWNAGIFAWPPDALLREARNSPLSPLVELLEADEPERGFEAIEPMSIDYAVMEDCEEAYVVPADFAWDDLGTWDAIARVIDEDLAESLELNTDDLLVAGDHHITAIDVSGLAIVAYDDRVLVLPRDQGERVREAVTRVEESGRF